MEYTSNRPWRRKQVDEKMDELRELAKQLPEIYDILDESFEFQSRGLRIKRDIVGNASQTFKISKFVSWVEESDGLTKKSGR